MARLKTREYSIKKAQGVINGLARFEEGGWAEGLEHAGGAGRRCAKPHKYNSSLGPSPTKCGVDRRPDSQTRPGSKLIPLELNSGWNGRRDPSQLACGSSFVTDFISSGVGPVGSSSDGDPFVIAITECEMRDG